MPEQIRTAAAALIDTTAQDAGYDAGWNCRERDETMPAAWLAAYDQAERERRAEMACAEEDEREAFDSGRWTREDSESMERGRDLPLRNDAGEYM